MRLRSSEVSCCDECKKCPKIRTYNVYLPSNLVLPPQDWRLDVTNGHLYRKLTLLRRMKIIQSDKVELLPERLVKTVAAKLK